MTALLLALKIIFILLMLAIVYQDFRSRAIYWWLPVLVFVASWALSAMYIDARLILLNTLANLCFVLLLLSVLVLYVLLRHKTLRAFTSQRFGLGDILVLLSVCPLMEPLNFILLMCAANLLMLLCELLKRFLMKSRETTIPYAGYLALFLSVWTLLTFYLPNINFLSDLAVYFLFSASP